MCEKVPQYRSKGPFAPGQIETGSHVGWLRVAETVTAATDNSQSQPLG